MKNTCPLVSVMVPVYGVEPYIGQCADALFSQTYANLEYVFVDDCSPDRSIEIVQEVLARYPARAAQVRIIRHDRNQGVSAARNTALDHVTGEWLLAADADDWVESDLVERLVRAVDAPDVDMVSCDFYNEFPDGCRETMAYRETPGDAMGWLRMSLADRGIAWAHWNKLLRRSLFEDHRLRFTPGANMGEDLGMMLHLCCHMRALRYVAAPLVHYRIRPDSVSNRAVAFEDKNEAALYRNMADGIDYIRRCGLLAQCECEMAWRILHYKFQLLKYTGLRYGAYVRDLMPESNDWIWRRGMGLSLRKRFTVWAGVRGSRGMLRLALHRKAPGRKTL